ncbi:MAG: beta-lactamase family protein [Treponema sp.]|jgi:CubicO group peptidase (beta-lactamase class C family)|nr:beta-lactamase family protein [Treponema sp.]
MNIQTYVEAIEKQGLKSEGVIVMQHGEKIAGHRWIPDTPKVVFSVSKSFTSIAVGMAIEEGKLNLKDRVIGAFPDKAPNADERTQALTLEHCLTMSRGYPEFTRPESVSHVLQQKLSSDPGSIFLYDNACTFLASAMLTKATGLTVRDYLEERLFRPLGIPKPNWEETSDGYTIGGTGLEVSTASLAVFGQFLLQRGNWKGKQLISASWIDCASRAHISTSDSRHPDYDLGYGYQFWPCRHGAYRCDGKDGQFVIVFPREDAVVAITSNEENMKPILYTVWDTILPQLRD